jgi:FKBP-type peptidyl-prolyl cis-trans isomerase FkpA
MRKIYFLPLLLIASCLPEPTKFCTQEVPSLIWTSLNQTQLQADIAAIDAHLDAIPQVAVEHPSGIRYVIVQAGSGDGPCLESYMSVKYTGKFLSDGSVFDSSSTPVPFYLNQLINGWQIGLLKASKGTKMTLYIPSGLAYGPNPNPQSGIPPNANLIFDLELVDFN